MSDIIKAQQGLARKAQSEPTHQFRDLYFLLCQREWIAQALQTVLSNEGARSPGIDGMSLYSFLNPNKNETENERFRQHFIEELQAELKQGHFRPSPVRRVEIPKPGSSKKRPLGIRTIKDRVVATLLKMVLEPIWESDFLYFSNGFRPTRCTMDCIQPFYTLGNRWLNYRYIIEGDIRNCFGSIPHTKLLHEVKRRIADWRILRLLDHFLRSGIMQKGKFAPSLEGVSQGDPLSPLLANIFLHRFDEWFKESYAGPDCKTDRRNYHNWVRRRAKGKALASAQMYRYADDWVILVRGKKGQAEAIKESARLFLKAELGLELSVEKTKLTHLNRGFDFLGYHIFRNPKPANRRRVGVFVKPAKANIKRVRQKIREMTGQKSRNDDYLDKLKALNAVVRGWCNYYRAVNPMVVFRKLDKFVWQRVQNWLRHKYQLNSHQVCKQYQRRRTGPQGGGWEYAALDESTLKYVWRYKAVDTPLRYYRPTAKKNWPNPYVQKVKVEQYELPTLKTMWSGTRDAAEYELNRRQVLGRANGSCENCGKQAQLVVHHLHRVGGKAKLKQADNRVEMLRAVCKECHQAEHRAERIYRAKLMGKANKTRKRRTG